MSDRCWDSSWNPNFCSIRNVQVFSSAASRISSSDSLCPADGFHMLRLSSWRPLHWCVSRSHSLKQNTTEYHKFKKLQSRDGTTETIIFDESALIETDLCLSQYPPAPPRISRRKKLTAAAAAISPPPPKNKNIPQRRRYWRRTQSLCTFILKLFHG